MARAMLYVSAFLLLLFNSFVFGQVDKNRHLQKVTILVDDSYPPYSYLSDGNLYGIYVDLVKQAAYLLRNTYKIDLQPVPWKRGVAALEQGEAFALMPPYIHMKKRPFIWPYSVALQEEVVVAFCNKGFTLIDVLSRASTDLPINVGLNAGFMILDEALMEAQKRGKIKIWENKNTKANIMKLGKKRIDCYINDRLSTLIGINNMERAHPEIDTTNFVEDKTILRRTAHIGYLREASIKFPFKNDFINKMDGALSTILERQEDGVGTD
ncbi:polar amino acid transport system substrate-binding protein [Pseudoalteromonas citrea]|uniref:Polar amino acid transport system substrate-binding protein n=2 Tax=Pseudoalteromonas citrea TaxID=43655 RepID=A0AAD4FQE2_9GAMM|nr:transporter substrate-binding domain-containing protein [Pseudoalteromonas citrea]KAF7765001.1 polar amino acid transport system substrate-binding protein [Pseudoalteromonas citrea]